MFFFLCGQASWRHLWRHGWPTISRLDSETGLNRICRWRCTSRESSLTHGCTAEISPWTKNLQDVFGGGFIGKVPSVKRLQVSWKKWRFILNHILANWWVKSVPWIWKNPRLPEGKQYCFHPSNLTHMGIARHISSKLTRKKYVLFETKMHSIPSLVDPDSSVLGCPVGS